MNNEMKCPLCGGNLQTAGSEQAANVRMEYQGDQSAKVRYYTCGKCGREYEIFDPTKDNREGQYREYWNG